MIKTTNNLTFVWCLVAGAVILAIWLGINN